MNHSRYPYEESVPNDESVLRVMQSDDESVLMINQSFRMIQFL